MSMVGYNSTRASFIAASPCFPRGAEHACRRSSHHRLANDFATRQINPPSRATTAVAPGSSRRGELAVGCGGAGIRTSSFSYHVVGRTGQQVRELYQLEPQRRFTRWKYFAHGMCNELCISNKVALELSSCIHVFRNEAEFLR